MQLTDFMISLQSLWGRSDEVTDCAFRSCWHGIEEAWWDIAR
jgi:hypothetical protein